MKCPALWWKFFHSPWFVWIFCTSDRRFCRHNKFSPADEQNIFEVVKGKESEDVAKQLRWQRGRVFARDRAAGHLVQTSPAALLLSCLILSAVFMCLPTAVQSWIGLKTLRRLLPGKLGAESATWRNTICWSSAVSSSWKQQLNSRPHQKQQIKLKRSTHLNSILEHPQQPGFAATPPVGRTSLRQRSSFSSSRIHHSLLIAWYVVRHWNEELFFTFYLKTSNRLRGFKSKWIYNFVVKCERNVRK